MAKTVLMVYPDYFGYNEETAISNKFQQKMTAVDIHEKVMSEFDNAVNKLRENDIEVITFHSPENCPDAVFPNNWFSTHEDGKFFIYPMLTPNRRAERNPEIIRFLKKHYLISETIDLSENEKRHRILEGTGSMVFDHDDKKVYACLSPRTNEKLLNEVARILNYTPIVFEAHGKEGELVYHTNVVMTITRKYAVICLDSIENVLEKNVVKEFLLQSGKKIITLSFAQMMSFAGNMLELENKDGKSFLIMSRTAFNSLDETQKSGLEAYSTLLPIDIDTIETIGGGSARCMMAEILVKKIP